ncbi:MAG: 50S ribosomal protein L3 [Verrucomicrobiia bacterium]|jgi:large subunit ribosomal protein L3
MIGLLAKKIGQTRVYDEKGSVISVTVVLAGPNRVMQKKTEDSDGYNAVQLGFDDQKESRITKPMTGHFLKHGKSTPVKRIKEFRDFSLDVNPGDTIGPDVFSVGDFVDAIGVTKGKGFQGVVKRYSYAGGPGSHGQKGFRRRPGSIAAGSTPGWVDKGKKMPGHMGQRRRTVQNLEIIQVREEDNLLLVKGAIPGANGDYIVIRESKKKPKKA